ncbi:hypothetical protein BJL95_02935 [Methylomonas sp. LWB]|nr:hypothetical protein BJL95_02935 [Methylomonas sp. LWB]
MCDINPPETACKTALNNALHHAIKQVIGNSTLSDLSDAVMPAGIRASSAMDGKLRPVRGAWISAIPAEMTSTTENLTR